MAKVRIYSVAKKNNIKSDELISKLKELGISVNNHFSSIDEDVINAIVFKNKLSSSDNNIKKEENRGVSFSDAVSDNKNKTFFNSPNSFIEKSSKNLNSLCNDFNSFKKKLKSVKNINLKSKNKNIKINGFISIKELSYQMSLKQNEIFSLLKKKKIFLKDNKLLDFENASLFLKDLGYCAINDSFDEKKYFNLDKEEKIDTSFNKNIVVSVMGHVDHGKTTLLQSINKKEKYLEIRGITQNINFYLYEDNSGKIFFIDTPGHEIFTNMRKKGAQICDIILLIIAIDDGIMPQTKDVIDFSRDFNIPLVIALNKVDLLHYNEEKIMNQLVDLKIFPELWGGDTQIFKVSALNRTGISELIEGIRLQYDLIEYNPDLKSLASGIVIDIKIDKGLGCVIIIIIKKGILKKGDYFVCGDKKGKIKLIKNILGREINVAYCSEIVYIYGCQGIPNSGDFFNVVKNIKDSKIIYDNRIKNIKYEFLFQSSKKTLENFMNNKITESKVNVIIKSNTLCEYESVYNFINNFKKNDIFFSVIKTGIGNINEDDIYLAIATKSLVLGFNILIDNNAQALSKNNFINIFIFNIIYDLINYINNYFNKEKKISSIDTFLGVAEVRQIFPYKKDISIAGCYITKGKFLKDSIIKIKRNNILIFTGTINSIRKFKEDVKEIIQGNECGIIVNNFNNFEKNDIFECFSK